MRLHGSVGTWTTKRGCHGGVPNTHDAFFSKVGGEHLCVLLVVGKIRVLQQQ